MLRRTRSRRLVIAAASVLAIVAVLALSYTFFGADLAPEPDEVSEQVAAAEARSPDTRALVSVGGPTTLGSGQATTGAWYELAFTGPIFPDDPANHRGGLDDILVGVVNRAQRTLDVAVYDFDLPNVAQAMARAAQRGVRVRVVTDRDTIDNMEDRLTQDAFATLRQANISVVHDDRRAIMHHKFAVVDGEWVMTGSWNFTVGETYRLNNHTIVVQSRALAANYAAEFEKMFTRRQFGGAKTAGVPNATLSLAGSQLENYFCPKDRCAAQVIRWISSARQRIHFMAFSFTHDGIADAMLERARAGVEVAGVFETTGSATRFSEFGRLKQVGLEVLQDGNPWTMHHKVIVIDDRVTIFGSFNFSAAADRSNDENLLIVDDVGLAAAFEAEYQRVRAVALNPPVRR